MLRFEWYILNLDPEVIKPISAVVANSGIYVTSFNDNALYSYTDYDLGYTDLGYTDKMYFE